MSSRACIYVLWFFVNMLISVCVRFTAGEVNTASDIDDALIGIKAHNSRSAFTVVIFASHSQANEMYEVASKHCNLGVDRRYVHFTDKRPSVTTTRSFNAIEEVIVGYHNDEGKYWPPHMYAWEKGAKEFSAEFLPEYTLNPRDNLMVCPVVKKCFRSGDMNEVSKWLASVYMKELVRRKAHTFISCIDRQSLLCSRACTQVLNATSTICMVFQVVSIWQKPQVLLKALIAQHMLVDGAFVVDAGCGSGSGTMAALRMGLNAIAYDKNPVVVKGVIER